MILGDSRDNCHIEGMQTALRMLAGSRMEFFECAEGCKGVWKAQLHGEGFMCVEQVSCVHTVLDRTFKRMDASKVRTAVKSTHKSPRHARVSKVRLRATIKPSRSGINVHRAFLSIAPPTHCTSKCTVTYLQPCVMCIVVSLLLFGVSSIGV